MRGAALRAKRKDHHGRELSGRNGSCETDRRRDGWPIVRLEGDSVTERWHINALWVAVFVAWLATGATFITGTMHSREADDDIQREIRTLKDIVMECRDAGT